MKRITDILSRVFLSMAAMLILLCIFVISIAVATFIENDFGTDAARALVYSATWFELLMCLLAANLTGNIIRHRLWQKPKLFSLLLHSALLVILAGAAVTKHFGYEGFMHIREGEAADYILSDQAYLQITVRDAKSETHRDKPLLLSPVSKNSFTEKIELNGTQVVLRYKDFIPNAGREITEDPDGIPLVSLSVSEGETSERTILRQGESARFSQAEIVFEAEVTDTVPSAQVRVHDEVLYFTPTAPIIATSMRGHTTITFEPHIEHELRPFILYSLGGIRFALHSYLPKGRIQAVRQSENDGRSLSSGNTVDALIVEVQIGEERRQASLFGGAGLEAEPQTTVMSDLSIELAYGSKRIPLPFALKLTDFNISRYPGSDRPSSFESRVILQDEQRVLQEPYRIYMNHILRHRGYRFFQASYDEDEMGTVLSISFDPGTPVTYVGYILLGLGLVGALVSPNGRFRRLGEMTARARDHRKVAVLLLVGASTFLTGRYSSATAAPPSTAEWVTSVDYKHSRRFGELLLQDSQGRIKPVDSFAHELLNKVARSSGLLGLHPDQVILGMIVQPEQWQRTPMIQVKHVELKQLLGISPHRNRAAFIDFFDRQTGKYKLTSHVQAATRKRPALQSKLDKELIKVDERVSICYMMYHGHLLRVFPQEKDSSQNWLSLEQVLRDSSTSLLAGISGLVQDYIREVASAMESRNWEPADRALAKIKYYQERHGETLIPSKGRIKAEIFLNNARIFRRLILLYWLTGTLLLLLAILKILRPTLNVSTVGRIIMVVLALGFVAHAAGLALRWYVSGHAPWSNGYETMIYIGWATVLSGFFFSKKASMPLAATSILAAAILFVAHLSWMDPQITPLVPVLKSYWLMIHVSTITASYGFLGLGALLALITLLLFAIKGKKNLRCIEGTIIELTVTNERTLLVGLVLLTVGTLFGAVWANESWGRYWGWDPKETWTLVTIMVYVAILHLRLLPSLHSIFTFNVVALLGFGSVLMTYFGVNYYLSGMHSYAQGDPLPVPTAVFAGMAIILVIVVLAYRKRKLSAGA